MKTLREFDVKGKKVLVRCDFNVPLNSQGEILDDFRIKQTLPTINYLIDQEAKIILLSHLGRPEGKVVESLRLNPVRDRLIQYFNFSITKTEDSVGREVENQLNQLRPGKILLLENIQFQPGETKNDPKFAQTLASYADVFIMEAFGQAHRNYASIAGIPKYLPSGAGFLVAKEIEILTNLMENPEKPLVALIGGAKVEEKALFLDKILKIADFVLISGLIQREIKEKNVEIKYPEKIIGPKDEIQGKDVGPEAIKFFQEKINLAQTIFWNGPFGQIEKEEFSQGTKEIAKAIIASAAFSVVGGGETVEFINKLGIIDKFGHVSTGGGAMLEFLSGEKLPGIEALG